uniref:Transgelin n=1 Tax=Acartia pacifica TaxID=335913 RepID=R9THY8_ACAPC|nr:calponin-3 [Acartia pacifica]AGN29587.1 calponin-3 [Acartia pacifica]
MAFHGPSYGLSRELHMKSQSKFNMDRARECMMWVEEVLGKKMEPESSEMKDQYEFANILKNGVILCELINAIEPGSVKKINTMNAPFKQRENIEMYLKACTNYGLKEQDLFQVNDLYENKNLYMIVDNFYSLGGLTQKKGWTGPVLGVKVASENKRNFDDGVLKAGRSVIGLQYGSNKGASQAGMTPYGATRQIRPEDLQKRSTEPDRT